MAFGKQAYTDTFSGSFGSYLADKISTAAQNAKQEKENQKKAEELGIPVPEEEKKGLFKKALGYEFGGRRFDRKVGPWMKGMSAEQSSKGSKFSDQFSYTKTLKTLNKSSKKKKSSVGKTTTKKSPSKNSFIKGFGEVSLQLEQINQRVSSLVSIANQQLGATYKVSGGVAGLQNVLSKQVDIQKDQLDQLESSNKESSIEEQNLQAANDPYKQTIDLTPGSDEFDTPGEGALSPGVSTPTAPGSADGGGGLFDTIAGAADIADVALDVGRTARNLGKRGAGRGLTRAGAAIGGRRGAKLAQRAGGIGSKFFGKAAGKAAAKGVAKGVGKSLIKKIPIIGAVAGLGFGIQRAMEGDWLGALGETASGLASTVPGAGTAVSAGIDAALIGKDIASSSPEPQAEGGVMPLSSRMAMSMLPGIGPIASMMAGTPGMKDAIGKGKNLAMEEAAKLPMKAIGGAILSVTGGFIRALGPVAGLVAPMIKQEIAPLSRVLGMPSSLVKFGGIGGSVLSPAPQAMKMGMDFLKNFMQNALEKLGIKPKKEEKTSSSGGSSSGGSGGGGDTSTETDDGTGDSATPSPAAPAPADTPGSEDRSADIQASKITREVSGDVIERRNTRGGGSQEIRGVTDKRLAVVKNSENGSETEYYHDNLGQLYKMNPSDGKITRVSQKEIESGSGDFTTGKWDFFRKPDKNVVLGRLQSMPVNSIKLATKEIVYSDKASQRAATVKRLKQPSEEEKKKLGMDSIKSPYGAPSAPQIQAASGISITSNGGGNKQLTPGRTFGFTDLNPHHSDEGRNRVYGGMTIGVPKDYGMGILPNYMPSGPNGNVPLPVAGKVVVKEWNKQSGYGRTVIVDTNLGKMQFSHLSKFGKFNVGDQLSAGTIVGVQGGSGNKGEKDYEDHLHLNATKKGHEAFVNFITSGKPTTGAMERTDSPGNEDAGNNQDTPEDPYEAFQQNLAGLLGNVTALNKAFRGESYENAMSSGKSIDFASMLKGNASPVESAGTTAPSPPTQPAAPAPTASPSRTPVASAGINPTAAAKPAVAKPKSTEASNAQAKSVLMASTGNTNSMIPFSVGNNTAGASFFGDATEYSGSARDLRPIHPNLA